MDANIATIQRCVQCGSTNSWCLKLRGNVRPTLEVTEEEESVETENEAKMMGCGHVVCIHCALLYVMVTFEESN